MKVLSLSKSAFKASLSLLLLTSCSPESLTAVSGLLTKMQAQKSDQRLVVDPNVKDQKNNLSAENTLQTDTRTEVELKGELRVPSLAPSLMVQTYPKNQTTLGMAEPPPEQPAAQGCLQALIRVRFGQFELNPSAQAKVWKGRLETSQGRFSHPNKIQFEAQDQLGISIDQRLVSFQTQTQPHYDGFSTFLQVPLGSPLPSVRLITEMGVKTLTFKELQHLNLVKPVDSTGNSIQILAELLPPQTGACGNTSPELPELRFPGENTEVNEDSVAPTPVESPRFVASVASSADVKTEAQF